MVVVATIVYFLRSTTTPINDVTVLSKNDGNHYSDGAEWYSHSNINLATVNKCTAGQRDVIQSQLQLSSGVVSSQRFNHCRMGCFEADWLDAFFAEEADIGTPTFLRISIGCKKGSYAILKARMGTSDAKFDLPSWIEALGNFSRIVCGTRGQGPTNFPARSGEMHCIEPMPTTIRMLNDARDRVGLGEEEFVVSHAAIASTNGVVKFPLTMAGVENRGIHDGYANASQSLVDVNLYSLDSYARKFVKGRGPINILSIDTEGWDFDVLFGASSTLDRTFYVEFEYHKTGMSVVDC